MPHTICCRITRVAIPAFQEPSISSGKPEPATIAQVSPTVLRSGPYRFFFFASDRNEPPHVHIAREAKAFKFWLSPVRSAYNFGFGAKELGRIERLVQEHEADLLKAWHEYFKSADRNGKGQKRPRH